MDELELNSPLHTPRLPYRPFGFLPGSTLLHASRKLLLCTKQHFWGAVRFDDDCGLEASRRLHRPMLLLFPRLSLGTRAAGMPPRHLVSGRLRQQRPLRSEPIAGKSTAAVRSAAVVSAMHVLGYPCALPSRDRAIVIKTRLISDVECGGCLGWGITYGCAATTLDGA